MSVRLRSLGVIASVALLVSALAAPASAQGRVIVIPPGEPIVLATFGVLSGPDRVLGLDWLNSVELAVTDRVGVRDGAEDGAETPRTLLGHQIELFIQDGLCTPEGGAQAANAIVSNPQVVGVIGSACSDETVGGILAITNAGLTTISPSATRPSLTAEDRGPELTGFLRTAHSDNIQGPAVASFLFDELGITRIATIHDGSAYAEGLVAVTQEEFEAKGGTITRAEAVQRGLTDFGPTLTAIAADPPEALYFPIFTAEGGFIVSQIEDVAGLEDTILVGSDGLFSRDFVNAAGPNVVGMYLSSPDFTQFDPEAYPAMLERYEVVAGSSPLQAFHAHGYDAANIMLNAIEQVAEKAEDGTISIDLAALRLAIYSTEGHEGVTGTLSCDEFGNCGTEFIAMYQITEEQPDVWPPPVVWQQ